MGKRVLHGNRIAGNTPQRNVTAAQIVYDNAPAAVAGQDRLTRYGQYTYAYTKNGELKTKTDSSNSVVTTYTYDALGNLTSVAPSNGPAISYVIDRMYRRVAKKRGTNVVKQWLYRNGLKPVAELDGSGIWCRPSCTVRIRTCPTS